jgi:hypothetical protein
MNNLTVFISFFSLFSFLNYLIINPSKIITNFISKRFNFAIIGIIFLYFLSSILYEQQAFDVFLFSTVGEVFRNRVDVYWYDSDHNMYPFFPFLLILFAGLDWVGDIVWFVNFMFLVKLVLLIPLFYISNWIKIKTGNKLLVLEFLTSPITYGVIFYHGQIDIVLMSFFILSMTQLSNKEITTKTILSVSFSYFASIASKTWSILFAPIIWWFYKTQWQIYLIGFFVVGLLFANIFGYTRYVFGSSIITVLPAILKPGGKIGNWGFLYLLPQLQPIVLEHKLLIYAMLLVIGYFIVLKKNLSFWKTISLFIFWLYIVAIHWAVQYAFWILPFILIYKKWIGERLTNLYLNLLSLYVFLNYVDLSAETQVFSAELINLLGIVIWILTIYIFYKLTKIKQSLLQ